MESLSTSASERKIKSGILSLNLMKTIFLYLDCKQLFRERVYLLNKTFYHNFPFVSNLFTQTIMQKLGIINDEPFELEYCSKLLNIDLNAKIQDGLGNLLYNYNNLPNIADYMQIFKNYPRKKSQH